MSSVHEWYRSDGTGDVTRGKHHQYHLGDIMNGKLTILLSGLVAILMVTCAVPFMASEDSDALTQDSNMALNSDRAIIYIAAGSDHSFTFTAETTDGNTGSIAWKLNAIGDGSNNVSFSDTVNTYTASGSSATVYGKVKGSIEVEAYVVGDEANHCASAVVVVLDSASATTDVFYFYFKVQDDDNHVTNGYVNQYGNTTIKGALSTWNGGFWVKVTQTEVQNYFETDDFNAKLALDYIVANNSGWAINYSTYGWINTFMGLGTYASGTTYYYWAQYHCAAGDGSWAFNNTTLEFITTQDHAYIGMVFWGSPSASQMPTLPTTLPTA